MGVGKLLNVLLLYSMPQSDNFRGIQPVIHRHCIKAFHHFSGRDLVAQFRRKQADWRAALITYAVGILTVAFTRYISLASLIITIIAPVLFWLLGHGLETIILLEIMFVVAWILHRSNIKRLLTGTERKFSLGKKEEGKEKKE